MLRSDCKSGRRHLMASYGLIGMARPYSTHRLRSDYTRERDGSILLIQRVRDCTRDRPFMQFGEGQPGRRPVHFMLIRAMLGCQQAGRGGRWGGNGSFPRKSPSPS